MMIREESTGPWRQDAHLGDEIGRTSNMQRNKHRDGCSSHVGVINDDITRVGTYVDDGFRCVEGGFVFGMDWAGFLRTRK